MFLVRQLVWLALGSLLSLVSIDPAHPHGGGLDAYGCHHNRKAGGYHCHRGQFVGQSFQSKKRWFGN